MIDLQLNGLIQAGQELRDINNMIKICEEQIISVKDELSVYSDSVENGNDDFKILCKKLTQICESVGDEAGHVLKLSDTINDVERLYRNCEERVLDRADAAIGNIGQVQMTSVSLDEFRGFLSQWEIGK